MLNWLIRKYSLWGFKKKCRLDLGIQTVMKDWVTTCIVERKQEGRRKELIDAQQAMKETEIFYQWLKTQK